MNEAKYLEAENESLKARIADYLNNDNLNKNIIVALRQKVSDFNNLQSDLNNKITTLQELKIINDELKEQAIFATNNEVYLQKELSQSDKVKHKLEEMEVSYINLQIQLEQATYQLTKLNSTVRYLEEQTSRMALLECLLTDVRQERDDLKLLATKKI